MRTSRWSTSTRHLGRHLLARLISTTSTVLFKMHQFHTSRPGLLARSSSLTEHSTSKLPHSLSRRSDIPWARPQKMWRSLKHRLSFQSSSSPMKQVACHILCTSVTLSGCTEFKYQTSEVWSSSTRTSTTRAPGWYSKEVELPPRITQCNTTWTNYTTLKWKQTE